MSDATSPADPGPARTQSIPGISTVSSLGLWIAIVGIYAFFLAWMFAGFSGYVARVNLSAQYEQAAQAADADLPQSLDEYVLLFTRLNELEGRVREGEQSINQQAFDTSKLQKDWAIANAQVQHAKGRFSALVERTMVVVNSSQGTLTGETIDRFKGFAATNGYFPERVSAFRGFLTGMISGSQEEEFSGKLAAIRADYDDQNAAFLESHQKLEGIVASQEEMDRRKGMTIAQFRANSDELGALRTRLPNEQRAILNAFSSTIFGTVPYEMLKIPTILLTMIVTIAAGGLGAVVAFTRKYLFDGTAAQTDDSVKVGAARLFLNVGEGVAASLAIFLFAGTGMLVLTQGAVGANGNIALSPYLVAFLAFLSGFMSEDAFAMIQRFGRENFNPEAGGNTDPANGNGQGAAGANDTVAGQ